MLDPGPALVTTLVLGLGPSAPPPGDLVGPQPRAGEPCVLLLSALYLGGPLEPCATPSPRRTAPPLIVPLDLLGHSASEE